MTSSRRTLNRRQLLAGAGGVSLLGGVARQAASGAAADRSLPQTSSAEKNGEPSAEAVVDALESAYGSNRGQRRYHTKGVGALGYFVGLPAAAVYSRSLLFSGETLPVVARFSVASGNPHASDTERSARGLGLQFKLPNGAFHNMAMVHTPMFFAKLPKTFLDRFQALHPDPLTGKPDPAKYREFLASHADSAAQAHFLADTNPPVSFAKAAYYGIHTFKFLDHGGKVTLVRFRFVPQDGERQLSREQMMFMPHTFLADELIRRTRNGPVRWDMIVTLGEVGDPETDPTVLWPPGRQEFKAGTLILTSAAPDAEAGGYNVNFDPLHLSDGVAATDDPILHFRSSAHAQSFGRRIRNT